MHLGQAVRINHGFYSSCLPNNGHSLSFMNYAWTPKPPSTHCGWRGHATWVMCASQQQQKQQPQKVRFNSANGAHFVISWLKSCRLALMLTQIEINKANPACPSHSHSLSRTSSSPCLLSITLALVATQMQTVFVCCVCLLDKLLSATFDSWLCVLGNCVCARGEKCEK